MGRDAGIAAVQRTWLGAPNAGRLLQVPLGTLKTELEGYSKALRSEVRPCPPSNQRRCFAWSGRSSLTPKNTAPRISLCCAAPCTPFRPPQLVEVVNQDYSDYVSLSTRLVNVDGAVLRMRRPLKDISVGGSTAERETPLPAPPCRCPWRLQRSIAAQSA